jgi:hypothetical protein
MEALANLLIAAVDLAEAEGRAVQRGVIKLVVRTLALIAAAVVGVVGVLVLCIGLYLSLYHLLGDRHWAASLLVGVVMLGLAGGLFLYGRITPAKKLAAVPDAAIKPKPEPVPAGVSDDSAYRVAT